MLLLILRIRGNLRTTLLVASHLLRLIHRYKSATELVLTNLAILRMLTLNVSQ